MKRMLLNATHAEEMRVAIVDGQELIDLDIEATLTNQRKGNIYKATITRIEPSLEAAFVDYGSERQGFLPLKEISRVYFKNYNKENMSMSDVKIQEVMEVGQELIVQIDKDERGNKGAALSTFISLAGRFLVLMPNNPKGGGISRRVSGEERQELKAILDSLEVPSQHALIARTAGIGRSQEELQWDLDFLTRIWDAISVAADDRPGPFLIYQENNIIVRALRDYLNPDIAEIIIDDAEVFERANKFMQTIMPQNSVRLKMHEDNVPLFSRYQIEHQIEAAFSRTVTLKSGAQLVIDHTEAVTAVDVNSARATSGSDIEETALKTNIEAAEELAKQIRIRDIGGLIIVDFIDMMDSQNQKAVERALQNALKVDRARVQTNRISKFGLLEMSRQRLRSALGESNYIACPHCDGTGLIRSVPSSALSILRIIEEEALKENSEIVQAYLPIEIATYLLNEKRHEVNMIERRLATRILLIPSAELRIPDFTIKRIRSEDIENEAEDVPSYKLKADVQRSDNSYEAYQEQIQLANANNKKPSVDIHDIAISAPPPAAKAAVAAPAKETGFLKSLMRIFGGGEKTVEEEPKKSTAHTGRRQNDNRNNNNKNPNNRNRNNRSQNRRSPNRNKAADGANAQQNPNQANNQAKNQGNAQQNPNQQANNAPKQNDATNNADGTTKPRSNNRGNRKTGGQYRRRRPRQQQSGDSSSSNSASSDSSNNSSQSSSPSSES